MSEEFDVGEVSGPGPILQEKPKGLTKARLTIVDRIYLQAPWESAQDLSPPTSTTLLNNSNDEFPQPYIRHTSVGADWKPLSTGWVENLSCLIIVNEQKLNSQVIPSEQEIEQLAKMILQVKFDKSSDDSCWVLSPGESMRGTPQGNLLVRCLAGTCRYSVTAIPR